MKKFKLLGLLLIYSLALASLRALAESEASTNEATKQKTSSSSSRNDNNNNASAIVTARVPNSTSSFEHEPLSGSASAPNPITNKPRQEEDDQATSPTMTSVHHQVWTSSSSGSLDELSPELISKLRGDVPFLAAYALRPRLVGASSLPSDSVDEQPANNEELGEQRRASNLVASASQQRQTKRQALIGQPKLSDFSELKVETSSTSKSEHHHKRKTTLKKEPSFVEYQKGTGADDDSDSARRRRLILATTSKLMIKRRRNENGRASRASLGAKSSSKKRGRKSRAKLSGLSKSQISRLRSAKLSRRSNLRRGHFKNGKLQAVSPPLNEFSGSGKTNEADGVKGGSSKGFEPFYKRRKEAEEKNKAEEPATNDLDERDEQPKGSSAGSNGPEPQATPAPAEREQEDKMELPSTAEEDDDEDGAQLEPPEPRRVGDPDVDEVEGDTVTVMPKFDGVDDDPEIPIEESEEPADSDSEAAGHGPARADGSRRPEAPAESDEPRGNRVNRDKSEQPGESGGGGSMVAGGGIGATIGGAGHGAEGSGGDDDSHEDSGDKETSSKPRAKSGVEFADKTFDEADMTSDERKGGGQPAGGEPDRADRGGEGGAGERPFDSRRVASDKGTSGDSDDDDDASQAKKSKNEKADNGSRSTDAGRGDGSRAKGTTESDRQDDDDDNKASRPSDDHHDKAREKDSSHGHGDEHQPAACDDDHDHGRGHGHHHDGIKWLQDAIPGEPGQDYPILSRANLTRFNCRDQKYAGYYADVEARCQVFHICQADGRQDSFL